MTEREVFFKNNRGFRLAGRLAGLREGENLPVVIFAHGLYSGKDSSRNNQISNGLVEKGLATFLIDFTGHSDSEGTMDDVSVEQFVEDLDAAVTFLEASEGVNPELIGVCGSSFGGTAALIFAASDDRIKALVLRSAPSEGYYEYGENVKIPTLIVQGEKDPIIRESETLFKYLKGEKELVLIEGAGHLYEKPEQLNQAKTAIAHWFKEKLKD
jgi:pimeloyl-ACP methyl ester carboxylesterase